MYEVRYGLMRSDIFLLPSAGLMAWNSFHLIITGRQLIGGFLLLLSAGYLGLRLPAMALRRVALRVDNKGVLLGWPISPKALEVPWSELEAVILRKPKHFRFGNSFVGLKRKRKRASRDDRREIESWGFDPARLCQSVKQFAPQVAILDERLATRRGK